MTWQHMQLTWALESISVRWRVAPSMVVVTQLVTHMSGANAPAPTALQTLGSIVPTWGAAGTSHKPGHALGMVGVLHGFRSRTAVNAS
jgi:hypothetical protein